MQWTAYRQAWSYPAVRQAALYGFIGKAPWFGAGIILTLHVVEGLGRTYAAAGVITAVFTLSMALSSPWRGRLLDTVGLRRTLAPSLIVLPLVFLAAPFANYWVLLAGMAIVGLLAVPWFVVTRQIIIAAVPVSQRRTGIALDSVLTEFAFIVGPALGVIAAVWWDTRWALLTFTLTSIAGTALLAWANPPLSAVNPETRTDTATAPGADGTPPGSPVAPATAPGVVLNRAPDLPASAAQGPMHGASGTEIAESAALPAPQSGGAAATSEPGPAPTRGSLRTWLNGKVAATFVASAAITFTLAGTDLSIVAATRAMDAAGMLAVVLAIWGAGSAVGGLLYGATKPGSLSLTFLVVALAVTTLSGALGVTPWLLAAVMALAGLFCAPSLAAAAEQLSHAVEERYRGEALGWQGTFSTMGNAMAPPLIGWVLDNVGWQAGFIVTGGVGLVIGAVGWLILTVARQLNRRRRHHASLTARSTSRG